jgi:hypothetical protein
MQILNAAMQNRLSFVVSNTNKFLSYQKSIFKFKRVNRPGNSLS